jgi:endonuclease G, mitochondrial
MQRILFLFLLTSLIFSENLALPKISNQEFFFQKKYYALEYSEEYEQAIWVYYKLTRDETLGEAPRKSYFKEDMDIPTGSQSIRDYVGSGYDRGHLAPAADMRMTEESMKESFLMSNMSPQNPAFNRGIWKKLEEQVREWARINTEIYVISGPIFINANPKTIGENKVAVPDYFFKVILDYLEPEIKAIGFVFPNSPTDKLLQEYAVTPRYIEGLTGLDFFSKIPLNEQESLETQIHIDKWFF